MAINSLSASSHGLSGLVSGTNTQEIVEKLLTGTQVKIDKAGQKKTTLQYKQQMYRDVSAKLKTLQSSFLSFSAKTNLLSNSFYNTMNAKIVPPGTKSAAFSVTASSNAKVGNSSMEYVKELATARTEKTTEPASAQVSGSLDVAAAENLLKQYRGADATLTITVGSNTINIYDAPMVFGGMSQSEVAAKLNDLFRTAGSTPLKAEASFVNNKLQIVAKNEDEFITIKGNTNISSTNPTLALKMFGNGITNLSGKGTLNAKIDTDNYLPGFTMNLDGRQESIKFNLNDLKSYVDGDSTKLVQSIQDQLRRTYGNGVSMAEVGGVLTFNPGVPSQKFTITGGTAVMGVLGLETGISNKLSTNMVLRDLNFKVDLQGEQQTFSINGVEFSYSAKTSLSTIMNDINNSKAGIKMSYSESEDRFVVQSSETGEGSIGFDVKQTQGNLMSVLFGERGGFTASGYGVKVDMVAENVAEAKDYENGGTFTYNINGTAYRFTVKKEKDDPKYTAENFARKMNEAFRDGFGYKSDGTQVLEFKLNDDGKFMIRSNDPDKIVKMAPYHKDKNVASLGFAETQSTLATSKSTTLAQAGINFGAGSSINFAIKAFTGGVATDYNFNIDGGTLSDTMTIDELLTTINDKIENEMGGTGPYPTVTYDERTASFKLSGVPEDPAGTYTSMKIDLVGAADSENLKGLFGQMSMAVGQDMPGGPAAYRVLTEKGQNAIFKLNGVEMQRASNTFEIDGLTFTLHNTTYTKKTEVPPAAGSSDPPTYEYEFDKESTLVTVTRDTDKIVEGIMEYLKLYNETIDYINDMYKADATYKDYAPLTSKQKADMSEKEIEQWEIKAKEGLLRNDSNLDKVLSSLRTAMYTKPTDSSIAIYDLGISTSFYSNDGNFSATNADSIRAAIEKDPDAVRKLFAGEGGIMELVNKSINDAVTSSYSTPGYLVQVAGSNMLDTSSSIYRQIKEVDDQLVRLEKSYWNEYNRYWKQFNNMEQLIQQMNTQSGWLSQMGG